MKLQRTEQTIDHITGEITKHTSTVVQLNKLPPEPEYIKLYVDDIGKLHGLSPTHREVLLYVAAASGYDGIATISTRRKAAIALTIGGSVKTVSNALTECVKTGLLRRVAHGEYEPNPFVFGRGSWAEIRERRERFVASFVYGPQGRQLLDTRKLSPEEAERLDKMA
jgi:hypothetical protein